MTAVQQPEDRRAVCPTLGKHDEHDIWWSYREAAVVPESQVRAEQPGNPWPYHCLGREQDLARPCSERYIDSGYGRRAHVLIPCMREADEPGLMHRGQHQAWEPMPAGHSELGGKVKTKTWRRLWTWHRGGAQGSARGNEGNLEPCPLCGILTRPATDGGPRYPGSPDAYSVSNHNLGGACFDCRLWAERVELHAAGWVKPQGRGLQRSQRTVRSADAVGFPNRRLQAWSEGSSGAYGDRKTIVTWHDGDSRGPASSLWDMGEIPWWLDEQFPVNAEVEWTR